MQDQLNGLTTFLSFVNEHILATNKNDQSQTSVIQFNTLNNSNNNLQELYGSNRQTFDNLTEENAMAIVKDFYNNTSSLTGSQEILNISDAITKNIVLKGGLNSYTLAKSSPQHFAGVHNASVDLSQTYNTTFYSNLNEIVSHSVITETNNQLPTLSSLLTNLNTEKFNLLYEKAFFIVINLFQLMGEQVLNDLQNLIVDNPTNIYFIIGILGSSIYKFTGNIFFLTKENINLTYFVNLIYKPLSAALCNLRIDKWCSYVINNLENSTFSLNLIKEEKIKELHNSTLESQRIVNEARNEAISDLKTGFNRTAILSFLWNNIYQIGVGAITVGGVTYALYSAVSTIKNVTVIQGLLKNEAATPNSTPRPATGSILEETLARGINKAGFYFDTLFNELLDYIQIFKQKLREK